MKIHLRIQNIGNKYFYALSNLLSFGILEKKRNIT